MKYKIGIGEIISGCAEFTRRVDALLCSAREIKQLEK
jgi:hypothetical protein